MRKAEETFLLEPERYEFRAMPMHQFALGRRDFFKIFGAGIAVFAVAKAPVGGTFSESMDTASGGLGISLGMIRPTSGAVIAAPTNAAGPPLTAQ